MVVYLNIDFVEKFILKNATIQRLYFGLCKRTTFLQGTSFVAPP